MDNIINQQLIKAEPTKQFFINMITRDLRISRAILDLVDNSVDAANSSGTDLSTKEIKIYCNENHFIIKDNCGGMKIDDAINYAFKFGRDEDRKTPNSVGQFGVGMKRTLFKLGNKFKVESYNDQKLNIEVTISDWLKSPDWHFLYNSSTIEVEKGNTYIKSFDLFPDSIAAFSNPTFITGLKEEIERAHFKALRNGIKIFLNDIELNAYKIFLKQSEKLIPERKTFVINDVNITITAGITERSPNTSGWYIICNGRLIEEAEKTTKTGWGNGVPAYHNDYAFFIGIVEFEAIDSFKLPWTTTKTGVDPDHTIYRFALNEMRKIMKPIINTLKSRVKEADAIKNDQIRKGNIEEAIKTAPLVLYENIGTNLDFDAPSISSIPNKSVNISYKVTKDDFEKVKQSLGENLSNKELGLETFKYYLDNECD